MKGERNNRSGSWFFVYSCHCYLEGQKKENGGNIQSRWYSSFERMYGLMVQNILDQQFRMLNSVFGNLMRDSIMQKMMVALDT